MVELQSTITCPACGHHSTETMPTDACQYLYACKQCGLQMKPKKGDCCVFCSYGDIPVPADPGGTGGIEFSKVVSDEWQGDPCRQSRAFGAKN
jgi:hypothetical protein